MVTMSRTQDSQENGCNHSDDSDYATIKYDTLAKRHSKSEDEYDYPFVFEGSPAVKGNSSSPALPPRRKAPIKKMSLGSQGLPQRFGLTPTPRPLPRPFSMDVTSVHRIATPCPVTLFDFVRNHSKDFPLRVTIEKGLMFCTGVEEASISSGDLYDVHFTKHTKVVYFTTHEDNKEMFALPVNSAVQVSTFT